MQKKLLSREMYEKFLAELSPGCCPFCEFKKYQIILKEYENWIWIATLAPYWVYHTMLVPKRHFQYLWEMTNTEMVEYNKLIKLIIEIYRKKELFRNDESKIKKYVFFWRLRDDPYDSISMNNRPDHFHLHIAPDKDHLWDPVVDPKAYLCNINKLVEL